MFEQLFERPKALAWHHRGPLVEERRAYLAHLHSDQGMARSYLRLVARYLIAVAESLRLDQRPDELISTAEIQERATLWANLRKQHQSRRQHAGQRSSAARLRFIRFATSWLRFLGRLQMPTKPSTPYDEWIAAFSDHLQRDKGLSDKTVSAHCLYARDFLQRLASTPENCSRLTPPQIEAALVQKLTAASYARSTMRHYGEALRAFFRYAQMQQWCPAGLAEGILLPRISQQEQLPKGPSWQVVQQVIAYVGGDHPKDIRARALLLLLATYGLRAGEVVRLRLQDFDWENEILVVTRPKCGRSQTFPLCCTVGQAVLRYLKEARPRSSHRQVFLLSRAPYRPLTRGALTRLICRRFAALGNGIPAYGPHALRHACATHLLECGLSLKEIGDHLGHQHPDSTRFYAKVDVAQLRRVADIDLGDFL